MSFLLLFEMEAMMDPFNRTFTFENFNFETSRGFLVGIEGVATLLRVATMLLRANDNREKISMNNKFILP